MLQLISEQNVIELLHCVNRPPAQFNYPVNGLLLFIGQFFKLKQLRLGQKGRQRIVESVPYLGQFRPVG